MDHAKGCFFGSIIGDVLGAPYEFMYPNEIIMEVNNEYSYGGNWNIPKGCYTDDTSMMLCLAESLVLGKDNKHQTDLYLQWYKNGYNSSIGYCFDIGQQTEMALRYYDLNDQFIFKNSTLGNGAVMRIAPVAIYSNKENLNKIAYDSIITTHNNDDNIEYSTLFVNLLYDIIHGGTKSDIKSVMDKFNFKIDEFFGSGRVDHSIYIACNSLLSTNNFEDALVYSIVNYGNDSDTNACITGALAGAYYGFNSIPSKWLEIEDKATLHDIFNDLYKVRMK